MKYFNCIIALFSGLLLVTGANAAITVTAIGHNSTTVSGTTVTVTTTGNCATGSQIVIHALLASLVQNATSASDGTNTYHITGAIHATATFSSASFYSDTLGSQLNSGSTITVNFSGIANTNNKMALVACVAGFTGTINLDIAGNTGAQGGSSTPSFGPTATLASSVEVAFGLVDWTVATGTVSTEDANFNNLDIFQSSQTLHWTYKVTGSNAALTYAPSLSASKNWLANIITFQYGTPTPTGNNGLLLRGIGP